MRPLRSMSDEISYYKARLDELTGQVIRGDSVVSRAKRELGQRRKALGILAELQGEVRVDMPEGEVMRRALTATARALKMDRSVMILQDGDGWRVAMSLGYPAAEDPVGKMLGGVAFETRVVTAATVVDARVAELREVLKFPYFVAVPVKVGEREVGLLVSGRLREQKPFYPALDEGDLATWQATAGFLGAALYNGELFRKTVALAGSFSRFVPGDFLRLLERGSILEVGMGDHRAMEMTVLFSDIRGFTSVSEKLSPRETFEFVNGYLKHAAPVIARHGGFIDKYIGDAIMALFPDGPAGAVAAGVELRDAVAAYNAESGLPPISVGVGVHSGPVILGVTGFANRLDCTVIADAVNLASRIEGLTKVYGSPVLASGEAWRQMAESDRPEGRVVDVVRVKGKREPVELVDVFAGDIERVREHKRKTLPMFEAGRAAYVRGDLPAARQHLEQCHGDLAAKVLLGRIAQFEKSGLPVGWDGVVALEAK